MNDKLIEKFGGIRTADFTKLPLSEIMPELAKYILDNHNHHNRQIRKGNVKYYARQIMNCEWVPNHHGISFDPQGELLDGQTRLAAIVEADMPAKMVIYTNVPRQIQTVIDQGGLRSRFDTGSLDGFDWTKFESAVVKMMMSSRRGIKPSHLEAKKFWDKYGESVRWVCRENEFAGTKHKNIVVAPVAAAISKAYYHCVNNRDRLAQFIAMLITGMVGSDHDNAAIRLRDYLKDSKDIINKGREGMQVQRLKYFATEFAIRSFLEHRPVTRMRISEKELYPLEWESSEQLF